MLTTPPPRRRLDAPARRVLAGMLGWVAALAPLAAAGPPMTGPPVTLRATLEPATVSSGSSFTTSEVATTLALELEVGALEVAEPAPLVVLLLLDVSGSMNGPKLSRAKEAAAVVLDHLEPRDRVALLTFEGTARDVYSPEGPPDLDEARRRVEGLRSLGGTNMVDGLRLAMETLPRIDLPGAVKRVLLLGDGAANLGEGDMERVAAWARDHDAAVSTFGVGAGFEAAVMRGIAARSGGNFHAVPDEGDLVEVFTGELEEMQETAGDRAQLLVKPSWGLGVRGVRGPDARLDAGPGVISLRSLVAGSRRRLEVDLVRNPYTPPEGATGRVDVSLTYRDARTQDVLQVHTHAAVHWVAPTTPEASEEVLE